MNSVRLMQLTDLHLVGNPERTLRGINTAATLRSVLTHARTRCEGLDALLLTGDLVHDDPAAYLHIARIFGDADVPVYCIPGNHDTPEQMRIALARPPFQVGGSAVLGSWVIVLLDSYVPNTDGGRLGTDQLAHLERTLSAHRDKHALICLHHHPIAMGSEWLDNVGLQDATAFRNLIARHRTVRGVVWGHVHQSLDVFMDGVRYMATPATCAQFKPHSDDFALDDKPPGYRLLELHPDGSIATEVLWVDNRAVCSTPLYAQAPAA